MDRSADPARIDLGLDSRAVTFENPTGDRGAGGRARDGRKGAPSRLVKPGESVELADLRGPGRIRHFWLTVPPAPPERMRGILLEIFYDDLDEPSVSVPCLDYFGCPLGRPVPYDSELAAVHEGRGFNSHVPIPFRDRIRVRLVNASPGEVRLFYQIDYTLESEPPKETGFLHATFRRENPTTLKRDFVIEDGLAGPGRFLGCNLGIRVLDGGIWYGEGEVKVFLDGDRDLPTICGTGLEDYVGSAWGMGPHHARYAGAPLIVRSPAAGPLQNPDFVGLYRWHVPDPIIFRESLRVTVQQIGFGRFTEADAKEFEEFARTHPAAGDGWERSPRSGVVTGIFERVDDYCATSFVYCETPQPVPRVDLAGAIADLERLPYERPSALERAFFSS